MASYFIFLVSVGLLHIAPGHGRTEPLPSDPSWCVHGKILEIGECLCDREQEDSCVGSTCFREKGLSWYRPSCKDCKCKPLATKASPPKNEIDTAQDEGFTSEKEGEASMISPLKVITTTSVIAVSVFSIISYLLFIKGGTTATLLQKEPGRSRSTVNTTAMKAMTKTTLSQKLASPSRGLLSRQKKPKTNVVAGHVPSDDEEEYRAPPRPKLSTVVAGHVPSDEGKYKRTSRPKLSTVVTGYVPSDDEEEEYKAPPRPKLSTVVAGHVPSDDEEEYRSPPRPKLSTVVAGHVPVYSDEGKYKRTSRPKSTVVSGHVPSDDDEEEYRSPPRPKSTVVAGHVPRDDEEDKRTSRPKSGTLVFGHVPVYSDEEEDSEDEGDSRAGSEDQRQKDCIIL